MDFSVTEDQAALRELARKILQERVTQERLRSVEKSDDRIDRELWQELARAHLLGTAVPEAHGGSGLGLTGLCLLLEEVGRAVAPVPVEPTLVYGALLIAEFGSPEQQAQWLPAVAAGDAILTAALATAAPGSSERPRAEPEGKSWRLSGQVSFVPAAHVAQRILIPARTEGEALGVFLVDPRCEGVEIEKALTTDQQFRSRVRLDRARVPETELVGEAAGGAGIMAWLHDRALLAQCAIQVGVAERALEMTARYTSERQQFDRPIGSFQAVHTRVGDAFVDLQAMKLTLWRALHVLEQGEQAGEVLSIAKFWAARGGSRITYAAQHLHGGIGIDLDYPLHRYYLWAREIGIHLGSAGEQLARIGASLAAR